MAKRKTSSAGAPVPTVGPMVHLLFGPDHTASMGQWRYVVRQNGCEAVSKWFAQAPPGRLTVGAFPILDLHDMGSWDFMTFPPSSDVSKVVKFIKSIPDAVGNTSTEECWERLFHHWADLLLGGKLPTGPEHVYVGIIVGDSRPHPIRHPKNREGFDWRHELKRIMAAKGVNFTLHTVYAPGWEGKDPFWQEAAGICNGISIEMDEFGHLVDLVRGVIARETQSFGRFYEQRKQEGPMSYAFLRALGRLGAGTGVTIDFDEDKVTANGCVASPGRFQPYKISEEVSTSQFFVDLGIIEDPADYDTKCRGSLFYVPVRAEDIRPKHEVIVLEQATGRKHIGVAARDIIGIKYGTKGKLTLSDFKGLAARGFKVAIQTMSREASNPRSLRVGQEVFVDTRPSEGFPK